MKWLTDYGWAMWCHTIGFIPDGKQFEAKRESAIKAFKTVIENSADDETLCRAITGIVQCLCGKGD